MDRVLVLSARRFKFEDDQHRQVEGVTIEYLDEGSDGSTNADQLGAGVLRLPGPVGVWSTLRDVPGYYRMDAGTRPGPKGRPTIYLKALQFEGAADLWAGG